MTFLRIATWNINSIRLRFSLVERFVQEHQPDILCLQETKCPDEHFPREVFAALGFTHQDIRGQLGYNGVATLAKHPLSRLQAESFCGTDAARHIGVAVEVKPGGQRLALHNIYVPAGGDIPDVELNPKFAQKLTFLRQLSAWSGSGRATSGMPALLVGDLNVAPLETDVWSHKQLLKVVSHTPIEVEHLSAVQSAGQWTDVIRRFVPADQKIYSWWSYRARDWEKADRGRRLDHIWATGDIAARTTSAHILKEARGWPQPSDHVPVMVEVAWPD